MATLDTLRNKIKTSIHGRRLGLDTEGFLVGPSGLRTESIAATSGTTGTALTNHGLTTFTMSTGAAKTYTLAAPVAGCQKELVVTSSSTKGIVVSLTNASLNSTAGSSTTTITFNGRGDRAILEGLSTSTWVAKYLNGAST